jgi:hypothetical protein
VKTLRNKNSLAFLWHLKDNKIPWLFPDHNFVSWVPFSRSGWELWYNNKPTWVTNHACYNVQFKCISVLTLISRKSRIHAITLILVIHAGLITFVILWFQTFIVATYLSGFCSNYIYHWRVPYTNHNEKYLLTITRVYNWIYDAYIPNGK